MKKKNLIFTALLASCASLTFFSNQASAYVYNYPRCPGCEQCPMNGYRGSQGYSPNANYDDEDYSGEDGDGYGGYEYGGHRRQSSYYERDSYRRDGGRRYDRYEGRDRGQNWGQRRDRDQRFDDSNRDGGIDSRRDAGADERSNRSDSRSGSFLNFNNSERDSGSNFKSDRSERDSGANLKSNRSGSTLRDGNGNDEMKPPRASSDRPNTLKSAWGSSNSDSSYNRRGGHVNGGSDLDSWSNSRSDELPSRRTYRSNIGPYGLRDGGNSTQTEEHATRHQTEDNMMTWDSSALQADSIESYTGTVKSINRVQYPNGTQVQMIVETEKGDLNVILGPAKYVDQAKVRFQIGDKVSIKGYRMRANGEVMVMASEVKKDGNTLQLRDSQRKPLWETNQTQTNQTQTNTQQSNNNHAARMK